MRAARTAAPPARPEQQGALTRAARRLRRRWRERCCSRASGAAAAGACCACSSWPAWRCPRLVNFCILLIYTHADYIYNYNIIIIIAVLRCSQCPGTMFVSCANRSLIQVGGTLVFDSMLSRLFRWMFWRKLACVRYNARLPAVCRLPCSP